MMLPPERKISTRGWSSCAGHTAEAGFLRVVTYQLDTFGFVLDDIGRYRRVVGYLLNEEMRLSAIVEVRPLSVEQSIRRMLFSPGSVILMSTLTYSPKTGFRGLKVEVRECYVGSSPKKGLLLLRTHRLVS